MLLHFKKSNEILETWSPHCKNLAFQDPPSLNFHDRTDASVQLTFLLVKDSSILFINDEVICLPYKSRYLCWITSVIVVPPLLNFCNGVIILSISPEVPRSKYLPSLTTVTRVSDRFEYSGTLSGPTVIFCSQMPGIKVILLRGEATETGRRMKFR